MPVISPWRRIEQAIRSAAFVKNSQFPHIGIAKNAGQNQSTCDLLCSALHLLRPLSGRT
ncbi:hypothetical protein HMPREF0542_11729 [Ligilactobacillus ruminis ATCC 25644]|uniref:Uncharacterized protein n=1 Tax=Ligilactobacillus ruminis ATCC 25644 TaxID=525362 RepID=E7FS52_9LACO|nr:hypothetical protein HMPREF0542_11729 [Ligilactobacillus ruminis ATCC 25644]